MGVNEGGVWVGVLLYADDMVLIAESEDELKRMMSAVDRFTRRWRCNVSVKKTKVMVCGEAESVRRLRRARMDKVDDKSGKWEKDWRIGGLEGGRVEEVIVFKYLGVELECCGIYRYLGLRAQQPKPYGTAPTSPFWPSALNPKYLYIRNNGPLSGAVKCMTCSRFLCACSCVQKYDDLGLMVGFNLKNSRTK